jgi:hypothetical protein
MKTMVFLLFLSAFNLQAQKTGEINFDIDINSYERLEGVFIFPNPVKDKLTVEFKDFNNGIIYLYNLQGKRIFKQRVEDNREATFDLSNLKKGTYMLFVIDKKRRLAANFKLHKL